MIIMDKYVQEFSYFCGGILADSICASADDREIIIFGVEEYLKYFIVFALISGISLILNIFTYAILATITFLAIRHRIGGIHFRNNNICLVVSVSFPVLIGSLSSSGVILGLPASLAVFILALTVFLLRGPVDTESVRLSLREKKRYRREGLVIFFLLYLSFLVLYLLGAYGYGNVITLSVMTIFANVFAK